MRESCEPDLIWEQASYFHEQQLVRAKKSHLRAALYFNERTNFVTNKKYSMPPAFRAIFAKWQFQMIFMFMHISDQR